VGQWVVAAVGGEWAIWATLGPKAEWATWVGAGVGGEWVGPEGARRLVQKVARSVKVW